MNTRPEFAPPSFRAERGGRLALAADWRIRYRGEDYLVPAGFSTDGASIPPALQWLCGSPFEVPRLFAALVHDHLYSGGDPEATRADADDLYRDLLIALGTPRWRAYAEWAALRLCGASHWSGAALALAALLALAGCATKTRSVEVDGLFTQAEAGIVALGSVDVMAAPVGEETALVKYEEDTAWLSPSTKTHAIRIQLTGTNSVASAEGIVRRICAAFARAAETAGAATDGEGR